MASASKARSALLTFLWRSSTSSSRYASSGNPLVSEAIFGDCRLDDAEAKVLIFWLPFGRLRRVESIETEREVELIQGIAGVFDRMGEFGDCLSPAAGPPIGASQQ